MTLAQSKETEEYPIVDRLKNYLQNLDQDVVVIRLDPEDRIRDYQVLPRIEVIAELHLNGFSENVEGRK